MSKITYKDKVPLYENTDIADINKVKADDMNEIKQVVNANTPVGSISLFAGATAPSGWLICDGSAISRTTYANLFSVIGTTYGAGDGSTTFNIPNLQGRVPVGLDSRDTDFDTLGKTGGRKNQTLALSNLPNDFRFPVYKDEAQWGFAEQGGTHYPFVNGEGNPFNIVQPYIVMNYIISY